VAGLALAHDVAGTKLQRRSLGRALSPVKVAGIR
jgi:hypothetical protein